MSTIHCFKRFAALILAAMLLFSLVSCAITLKGTYTNDNGIVKQSFTFKEDNVVAMSAFGVSVEGTYVIEDGKITITYKLLGLGYDLEKSFEKKGDTIIIDGTEFVKEK